MLLGIHFELFTEFTELTVKTVSSVNFTKHISRLFCLSFTAACKAF